MSCKALKLSSCEIKGSTFAGRKFTFLDRDISEDTFVAKVRGFYNDSHIIAEIEGVKDEEGNVYFPKTPLESYQKGNYTIDYWATFQGLEKELIEKIAVENFKISIDACDCGDSEDSTFTLTFPEETIEYSVEIAVINIGGGGDTSNLARRNGTNITNPENWKASLGYVTDISGLATTTYVNETFQPIGNYLIPSDIANLASLSYVNSTFATIDNTYTKTEVDGLLTAVYRSKGSVDNFASLPTTNRRAGDVWNLLDTGDNYVWVTNLNNTGVPGWDKLSGVVDLSAYQTTSSADAKYFLISNANADNISETSTRVYLTPAQKAQIATNASAISTNATAIANKNSILETRANIPTKFWTGTQAQYDAIVTKDSATLYFIQ